MNRAAFLCVNHDRSYIALAYQSVASFRSYNRSMPIIIFTEQSSYDSIKSFFRFENLQIVTLNAPDTYLCIYRWQCINLMLSFGYEYLLYIDVDTIFYKCPSQLFDKYQDRDIAARREIYCKENHRHCQIDFGLLRNILRHFKAEEKPILNLGVVLLKRSCAKKIHAQINIFSEIVTGFLSKTSPYPSSNYRIADEIAFSIVLGQIDASVSLISPRMAPFFYELSILRRKDLGVVIHYWNEFAHLKASNPFADLDGSRPVSDANGWLP